MNSAAVIGRQLRQQNPARFSGPLVPPSTPGRGRPKSPTHQPLYQYPSQTQTLQVSSATSGAQAHNQSGKLAKERKKKGLAAVKEKVNCRCIIQTCKALCCGMFLIMIGTTMSVVGFYAPTLSKELVQEGNKTVEVTNEDTKYHLHNLTFVGPVFMGLGGFAIVASCVMTFEGPEANARVVPIRNKRPSAGDVLSEQLLDGPIGNSIHAKEKLNGPNLGSPFLMVPTPVAPLVLTLPAPLKVPDKGGGKPKSEVKSPPSSFPNGPNRQKRPSLPLKPLRGCTPPLRTKPWDLMSPQLDFVPSPQDVQLTDPDGCDTPMCDSLDSMEIDTHRFSNCPITVKVQLEPRYLASIETLSDTDSFASEDLPTPIAHYERSCDGDLEEIDQEMPLLGRCSPPSPITLRPEMELPLLKRDGIRRFPLLRQGALENGRDMCDLTDIGPT